jgi:signal transduction histidine kinase
VLTLLVLQGPDKGQRFELLDDTFVIGRESAQVPLSDNTVSRRHCEISQRDGIYILSDLSSANGTFINGLRVRSAQAVRVGDQLRIGRTLMVFGSISPARIARAAGSDESLVEIAGEEAGVDSAIMHTVGANDDSLVLAVPDPSAAAVSNLQILYKLGAALSSAFDIRQAMTITMDLIFEHVKAERGLILLRPESVPSAPPAADLETVVVRTREEKHDKPAGPPPPDNSLITPPPPTIRASRTIINHVLTSGEGVLSSNAMADRRFSKGRSVHDLGIHSALCVPIKARRFAPPPPSSEAPSPNPSSHDSQAPAPFEVLGVIYIDSSVRNYSYSPDQLRLLSAIGMQAGMAVQNAKLYQAGIRAERLAAIGETTAALSHSIKNILQALRGGADVVEMGLTGSNLQQASKGWGIVNRNLDKIYNLTMNLLAFSRPRTPDFRPASIPRLLADCVELVAPSANERGIMVVADVDQDQPPVPIDEDGLHQVLMNLLSNALDAAPQQSSDPNAKGLITAASRYDPATDSAVIEITDNGPGIHPAMRDHLFELFHSTKGNRGTGLGLAVSKKIIEEHDGSITVKSPLTPTGGTTFQIRLPMKHLAEPTESWAQQG